MSRAQPSTQVASASGSGPVTWLRMGGSQPKTHGVGADYIITKTRPQNSSLPCAFVKTEWNTVCERALEARAILKVWEIKGLSMEIAKHRKHMQWVSLCSKHIIFYLNNDPLRWVCRELPLSPKSANRAQEVK